MTNNNIPEAVLKAAAEADKILMEQQKAKEAPSEIVTFEDEELEINGAEPVVTEEIDMDNSGLEINAQEETEEVIDDRPSYDELEALLTKERARYSSIKGKYNAEGKANRDLIANLEAKVETMEQAPVYSPDVSSSGDFGFLSDSEREEYDKDTLAVMDKIAQSVASKNAQEIAELKEELRKRDQINNQKEADSEFERRLTELVPNWKDINSDPDWFDWLDSTDLPIIGNAYDAIHKFDQEGNVEAVAEIFKAYKSPVKGSKGLKVPDSKLSPARAKTSSKVSAGKPKQNTYTKAFLKTFYNDYARGSVVYNGRRLTQKEMDFIYKDIDVASAEGRIV